MTGFLYLVHGLHLAKADMIRAVGSIFTRSRDSYLRTGLTTHLATGIIFAFIYIALWHLFDFSSPEVLLLLGALTGFVHGLVVSFFLVIFIAEHHPLPEFRRVGFPVALTHLIAHVVYGTVLAYGVYRFHIEYNVLPQLVQQNILG